MKKIIFILAFVPVFLLACGEGAKNSPTPMAKDASSDALLLGEFLTTVCLPDLCADAGHE